MPSIEKTYLCTGLLPLKLKIIKRDENCSNGQADPDGSFERGAWQKL
jgi:hypothetical protein